MSEVHSVHSFMLPFRWDYLPTKYSHEKGLGAFSFEERTNLDAFLACLTNDKRWKRKFYRINQDPKRYNEYAYFHAYATKTLFDLQQQNEPTEDKIDANKVMVYFELNINATEDTYIIETLSDTFTLNVRRIALHVYNTGVAILTFNLENEKHNKPTDILAINEYGRRIYPQFLDKKEPFLNPVKSAFLANRITLNLAKQGTFTDDFSDYEKLKDREVHHFDLGEYKRSWVIQVPKYIRSLFNPNTFCFIQKEESPEKIRFNLLTDDRMFFTCWYGNDMYASILKEKWEENDFWYSYIFGDKSSPSIANKAMQRTQIEQHTYTRWSESGSLFGMTCDSFVVLGDTQYYSVEHIKTHTQTMYYQMAILVLTQRACILRFNAETTMLTDLSKDAAFNLLSSIQELYKNYIEFRNKIYFREITPYIQGIEMYDKFQEVMKIEGNVKDLDEEINELHEYVNMEGEGKMSKLANAFVPASIVMGLISIALASKNFSTHPDYHAWAWVLISTVLSLLGGWLISKYFSIKFKP